jgi:TDG/mug DNA glycosylase family protein
MARRLPDIATPGLSVVFCGLNPGLGAAATGHHFVGRGNRFWRVLHLAGFTPDEIRPEEDRRLLAYGLGVTAIVERPTASAMELARGEFVAASAGFERWVRLYAPRCVAFLGKAAYAGMTGLKAVPWGRQQQPFGGAIAWVLPNPSGRNRAFTLDGLAAAYRALRLSAEAGFDAAGPTAPDEGKRLAHASSGVERSWTADEGTAAHIESQRTVRLPRNADPDAATDVAALTVVVRQPERTLAAKVEPVERAVDP